LPLLDLKLQSIFIWYVMLFPLILLVSFFLTWNFNSKVLYPPSEFKDEKNYLNLLGIEGQQEIINLQANNLDNLQKQLLEVKELVNNIDGSKKDAHSSSENTYEPDGQSNNQTIEKGKKSEFEVNVISEKLTNVLHNVEVAQTYQQVVSEVVGRRNLALAKYAVNQTNGKCELCKAEPNIVKKDGSPYLEVHHVIPLSKGGNDVYENIVVLCPNCHKRVHISNEPEEIQNNLREILRQRKSFA